MEVRIEGVKPLVARLERIAAYKAEIMAAMQQATLLTLRELRMRVPVDQGLLRAGTAAGVSSQAGGVQGVVGISAVYGPAQERGTKPYWPGLANLEGWAKRHGMTAYVVCKAIARRGNVALWFARNTVGSVKQRVFETISAAVRRIVEG